VEDPNLVEEYDYDDSQLDDWLPYDPEPNDALLERPIGEYGKLRKRFLEEKKKQTYDALLIKGLLNAHLIAYDRRARSMKAKLIAELTRRYPPPERARGRDSWERHMKELSDRAEKIVLSRFLYR
jgi:hypothetical protein